MKIRADEHVSPTIVRMVCELASTPNFELSSVYDVGHDGTEDQYWATAFAGEGGEVILTADTDFFKKPHLVVAIDNTGLRVIYLPPRWANAPGHMRAAHILMWWARIEKKLSESNPREIWTVPWNVNEDGELKRKKVNYGAHHKKIRKARRRTS